MKIVPLLASRRIQLLLAVLLIAAAIIAFKGINQGIEFKGGVRIPISLEHPVDSATMDSMVETIKLRINKFGLSQAVVQKLGDQEIIVEIPKADSSVIASVEKVLREQGKFQAIIDGKVAIAGEDIILSAVGGPQNEGIFPDQYGHYSWELGFAANRQGAEKFSRVGFGKANYPVYMFLDRPESAAIIIPRSYASSSNANLLGAAAVEQSLRDALKKEGDDILLVFAEDFSSQKTLLFSSNKSRVIVPANFSASFPEIAKEISSHGLRLVEKPGEDAKPVVVSSQTGIGSSQTRVSSWKAIGLISSPTLSAGLAEGQVSQFYMITGGSSGDSPEEQKRNAFREKQELKSVISGGMLPVSTVIGSSYSVAPSLGEQFMAYSWIGLFLAVLAVAILIVVRYRRPSLVFPIVFVNACEIFVTTAFIGLFTLDLSAMAGIIAMIGTGVNDQLIITDEMLRKRHESEPDEKSERRSFKDRISKAFYVVFTIAGIAIVAMSPLALSDLVEIRGFAISSIVGVLVGVLVTRPAFGVIIEELFKEEQESPTTQ